MSKRDIIRPYKVKFYIFDRQIHFYQSDCMQISTAKWIYKISIEEDSILNNRIFNNKGQIYRL